MADAQGYESWRKGEAPQGARFRMPDREGYAAWKDTSGRSNRRAETPGSGQEASDEESEYGPKTAAMPESKEVRSEEFRSIIDVGALPEGLKERAWRMLEKNSKAFGLDGRLGDYPAKATIRTKEGVNPIAVPMHSASPAKRAVIDEQIDKWFAQGVIEALASA
ncbi:hypothetical protein HDZ31DRAFT_70521 [Schizophyllum fasciatum]